MRRAQLPPRRGQLPRPRPLLLIIRKGPDKPTSRSVPAFTATPAQIAEHQRFRRLTGAFVEVSEQLCDARLRHTGKDARNEGARTRAEQFAPAVEGEIAGLVSPDACGKLDFEAVETATRRQALRIAARAAPAPAAVRRATPDGTSRPSRARSGR